MNEEQSRGPPVQRQVNRFIGQLISNKTGELSETHTFRKHIIEAYDQSLPDNPDRIFAHVNLSPEQSPGPG